MTIYNIILSYLSLCCFLDIIKINKEFKLYIFIITVFFLILFAGLRGSDPDWNEYASRFKGLVTNNGLQFADAGFNMFCKIISFINHNPITLFLSVALISISLNTITIARLTPFIFSALILYFCHNYCLKEMIQIRVGMASALCLFSLYYYYKHNLKVVILLLLIAASIHITSCIFGLVYIINHINNKKIFLYCVIISLIIGTLYPLGSVLKSMIGFGGRLDAYIAYGDSGYGQSLGIWSNLNAVKCLIIFCGLYYYYDELSKKNKYFYLLFRSYVFGLCWLICFNDFAIIGARMSNILLSTEPILLTYPYTLFKKGSRFIYSLAIIFLSFIIFSSNIAPDKITPYHLNSL